jgi:APA family basic amino acid/polyamine antiporter
MHKKMKFSSVLAIVFGSQIGSGIFILPANLAPFGMFGICGWCIAGLGAMLLAFVFSELCYIFPKTGGPYAYVRDTFGAAFGFFIGWLYWLVSWISSTVIVITAVSSLNPFLGENNSPCMYLLLETCLLASITAVNCASVQLSGKLESVLTLLKFMPFAIVPLIIFPSFDASNICIAKKYSDFSAIKLMIMVTISSFWGFIGVECATTPADAVANPAKTIPKAIIVGTVLVAAIYFVNNLAIMGAMPGNILENSQAPFVDVINFVFGKNASLIIALVIFMSLVGTLNAWVLTSAQISLGLAQDRLFPSFFARKNTNGSPYISVLISTIGMIPILVLTKNEKLSEQIMCIIDFSLISFFIVYAACCLALVKTAIKSMHIGKCVLGIVSFILCMLLIIESSVQSIMISLLFVVAGAFVFLFIKKKKNSLKH